MHVILEPSCIPIDQGMRGVSLPTPHTLDDLDRSLRRTTPQHSATKEHGGLIKILQIDMINY